MPRKPSSRKFQLTINNPADHGFTHERIRTILSEFSGAIYWCMCDEVGEQGTPHTHVYVVFKNSTMFDTLHGKFYGAHIEQTKGSNQENRDYVRKEGKWLNDAKHETNLADTFEEWGELPPDRTRSETQAEQIMQMVMDGKSDAEILRQIPGAYNKLPDKPCLLTSLWMYIAKGMLHICGVILVLARQEVSLTSTAIVMFTRLLTTPILLMDMRDRM